MSTNSWLREHQLLQSNPFDTELFSVLIKAVNTKTNTITTGSLQIEVFNLVTALCLLIVCLNDREEKSFVWKAIEQTPMMFAYHVSMFRTKNENVSVSFYGFYKEKKSKLSRSCILKFRSAFP